VDTSDDYERALILHESLLAHSPRDRNLALNIILAARKL
jgi:hypothetical protein